MDPSTQTNLPTIIKINAQDNVFEPELGAQYNHETICEVSRFGVSLLGPLRANFLGVYP